MTGMRYFDQVSKGAGSVVLTDMISRVKEFIHTDTNGARYRSIFRPRSCVGCLSCILIFLVFCWALYGQQSFAATNQKGDSHLIPSCLIGLNLDPSPGYALVVEKASQELRVYEWRDGFSLKHTFPCSTGEVSGKKEKTGDRRTPEGVYFVTKTFTRKYLSETYGSGAFVLDYPNFMDRKLNRSGYNIWIHGTNKRLKPRDTNGCVTMENRHLDILHQYIELNRTPIIIKSKLKMICADMLAKEKKALSTFLQGWKRAFLTGDRSRFDLYYEDASLLDETLWETWDGVRPNWEKAQVPFAVAFRNMTLARSNPCVVALFDQVATLDKHTIRVGTVKLFLEPNDGSWKIVGEEYQPNTGISGKMHPIAASLTHLEKLRTDYKTVGEVVAEWADAWSSKDMDRYRACYADDFYSRKMNVKAWIAYKKRLAKRYKKISVSVEDLEITQEGQRSTATFVQRYSSNKHQSVGLKRLRLKQDNGLWKIYRETFQKM